MHIQVYINVACVCYRHIYIRPCAGRVRGCSGGCNNRAAYKSLPSLGDTLHLRHGTVTMHRGGTVLLLLIRIQIVKHLYSRSCEHWAVYGRLMKFPTQQVLHDSFSLALGSVLGQLEYTQAHSVALTMPSLPQIMAQSNTPCDQHVNSLLRVEGP